MTTEGASDGATTQDQYIKASANTTATASELIMSFISEQLSEERARKTAIEQRGIAIVTTSGTLVTLLFALSAVVGAQVDAALPRSGTIALRIAVIAFLAAACLGLSTNLPMKYAKPRTSGLLKLVNGREWLASATVGARAVARAKIAMLRTARRSNALKTRLTLYGIAAEILAVGAVAFAVWFMLQ